MMFNVLHQSLKAGALRISRTLITDIATDPLNGIGLSQ
jgi:hypothetical protein